MSVTFMGETSSISLEIWARGELRGVLGALRISVGKPKRELRGRCEVPGGTREFGELQVILCGFDSCQWNLHHAELT